MNPQIAFRIPSTPRANAGARTEAGFSHRGEALTSPFLRWNRMQRSVPRTGFAQVARIAAKRCLDIVGATLGLVLLAPLMALIVLAVRLNSPGPALYRTYRVGKSGRLFDFYKFRTMVDNADLLLDHVWEMNEREGILFKTSSDPRVTTVGRFLRRFSFDELPQLWNILRGDMSLVGPRPPLLSEYEQFRPDDRRRTSVLPGLTGLWQVSARSDPSFERYVRLDCEYVDHWSLWLDLKIIAMTVPAVLRGTGQ